MEDWDLNARNTACFLNKVIDQGMRIWQRVLMNDVVWLSFVLFNTARTRVDYASRRARFSLLHRIRYRLEKKASTTEIFWLTYGIFAESNVIVKTNESIWSWLAVLSMYMKTFWLSESFSFFNDKKNYTRAVVRQTYRGTCKGQWLGTYTVVIGYVQGYV